MLVRDGRTTARYGLRAQRIGEASNPGPASELAASTEIDEGSRTLLSDDQYADLERSVFGDLEAVPATALDDNSACSEADDVASTAVASQGDDDPARNIESDCGRPLNAACGCYPHMCEAHTHYFNHRIRHGLGPTAGAWTYMNDLDLEAEIRKSTRTVRDVPRWFRASLRHAFMFALRARHHRPVAGWKLFILIPRMLLRPTEENGEDGKRIFLERYRRFQAGDWASLLQDASANSGQSWTTCASEESDKLKRREAAADKVRLRELSRARMILTSLGLAPGSEETLHELQNEELRPRELSEALPQDAL
eukprot:700396-Karenia_brevis.AAC.1